MSACAANQNHTDQNHAEQNSSFEKPTFSQRLQTILTSDFCPQFNKYIYWMKHPLALGAFGMISSLLLALFMNQTVFLALLGIAAVLLIAVVWPWITVRGLRGELILETRRARIGQSVTIQLKLTNKWPWPLWGLMVSKGFFALSRSSSGLSLSRMPAWTTAVFTWNFTPEHRGVYPVELPQLETSFPLGLFTCRIPVECRGELIVWTETVRLEGLPDSHSLHFQMQNLTDRKAGDFGDLIGTRAFREGDSLRRIHWGQSARMQSLIVCERQAPASASAGLIVDARSYGDRTPESDRQLEQVLSISASIVESLLRQNAFVSCELNDSSWQIGGNYRDYERFMDALARIPVGGENGPSTARTSARSRCETAIVVATWESPLFAGSLEQHKTHSTTWIKVGRPKSESMEHPPCSRAGAAARWQDALQANWRKGKLCHVG